MATTTAGRTGAYGHPTGGQIGRVPVTVVVAEAADAAVVCGMMTTLRPMLVLDGRPASSDRRRAAGAAAGWGRYRPVSPRNLAAVVGSVVAALEAVAACKSLTPAPDPDAVILVVTSAGQADRLAGRLRRACGARAALVVASAGPQAMFDWTPAADEAPLAARAGVMTPLTCAEAADLFDVGLEPARAGRLAQYLPGLAYHLVGCPACREEFDWLCQVVLEASKPEPVVFSRWPLRRQ